MTTIPAAFLLSWVPVFAQAAESQAAMKVGVFNQRGHQRDKRRSESRSAGARRELDSWVTQYRALWVARLDAFGDALARKQQARRPRRKRRT